MNIDYVLPPPTEEELNLGHKADYFTRIIEQLFICVLNKPRNSPK